MIKNRWTVIVRTQGNRNSLLSEALRSVEKQQYKEVSAIIAVQAPDAKTYENVKIHVESLHLEIPYTFVRADAKLKRGAPINKGLDACNSEFVSLLDDDDILYPSMGKELIPFLIEKKCNFVYGNTLISRRTPIESGFKELYPKTKGFGIPFNPIRLAAENYIHPSSVIYNFKEFKEVRTHTSHVLWEDWYLFLQLLFTDRLKGAYIDTDVSEYRIIGDNETNSFHKFSNKELRDNYHYIKKQLKDKRFSVSQSDVFMVYPELALINDHSSLSDIQKLLDRIHELEELQNRKFVRLYSAIMKIIHKYP